MRRWLPGVLWLFLLAVRFPGRQALLAPPLPPLPIEESAFEHKFNQDGSPDEELQLSLFKEKSDFAIKSEEMDLLTDDITRKSGESREKSEETSTSTATLPTTTSTAEREEVSVEEREEHEEDITEPMPPAEHEQAAIATRHHAGPPSISPPAETTPTTTTTTEEASTTTSTVIPTTTEATTTTTPITTTATEGSTEEPRILIPVPGAKSEELLTAEEPLTLERIIIPPEEPPRMIIPQETTPISPPLILIPLPDEETTHDEVQETSFNDLTDFTTLGPEDFPQEEPLITIPLPGDVTIIPTVPNRRITVVSQTTAPVTVTRTTPEVTVVFNEPEREEEIIATTLPSKMEERMTETELIEELVKNLPHVGTTFSPLQPSATVIPPRITFPAHSTRRTGDVQKATIRVTQRILHRGEKNLARRKKVKGLRTRRPMKIRPTTPRPKSFRSSSDVVHHPKQQQLQRKKIRRLRKKKLLGESRFRVANQVKKA